MSDLNRRIEKIVPRSIESGNDKESSDLSEKRFDQIIDEFYEKRKNLDEIEKGKLIMGLTRTIDFDQIQKEVLEEVSLWGARKLLKSGGINDRMKIRNIERQIKGKYTAVSFSRKFAKYYCNYKGITSIQEIYFMNLAAKFASSLIISKGGLLKIRKFSLEELEKFAEDFFDWSGLNNEEFKEYGKRIIFALNVLLPYMMRESSGLFERLAQAAIDEMVDWTGIDPELL